MGCRAVRTINSGLNSSLKRGVLPTVPVLEGSFRLRHLPAIRVAPNKKLTTTIGTTRMLDASSPGQRPGAKLCGRFRLRAPARVERLVSITALHPRNTRRDLIFLSERPCQCFPQIGQRIRLVINKVHVGRAAWSLSHYYVPSEATAEQR